MSNWIGWRFSVDFLQPQNQKDIVFSGLTGYYRKFNSNFAKISKPRTKLLQKDKTYNFDSECVKSFKELEQALTASPILI